MSGENVNEPRPAPKISLRLSIVVLWVAVGVALLVVWGKRPPDLESSSSAEAKQGRKVATPVKLKWNPEGVEAFSLTERSGRTVTNKDLLGRPWVVSFVFTRCAGPCRLITGQFRELQDSLFPDDGSDPGFRLVTLTVDPKRDTPEQLANYAELFKAHPEYWLFLTGDQNEIYHLIQKSFQNSVAQRTGKDRQPGFEVEHTGNVLLVDADGRVREKFPVLLGGAVNATAVVRLRRTLKKIQSGNNVTDAISGE